MRKTLTAAVLILGISCSDPGSICGCLERSWVQLTGQVLTASGGPVGNAAVTARIFIEDCGHGWSEDSPELRPARTDSTGTYNINASVYFAPGPSCLRLTGVSASPHPDSVVVDGLYVVTVGETVPPRRYRFDLRFP